MKEIIEILRKHKVQPTPQRIAIGKAVLRTRVHTSADDLWKTVKETCPTISTSCRKDPSSSLP